MLSVDDASIASRILRSGFALQDPKGHQRDKVSAILRIGVWEAGVEPGRLYTTSEEAEIDARKFSALTTTADLCSRSGAST